MENRLYFEQFAGDVDEIEIIVIPFSANEFAGFDELKRQQIISIAQTFMISSEVRTADRRERISMEGLTEGRIVHYVLENGEHRPGIIVKVWDKDSGTVNLQVFTDGLNDEPHVGHAGNINWTTSVPYSESPHPATWHWIERA